MKKSILLIEDSDDFRLLLKEGLEGEGYNVVGANCAKKAIQALEDGFRPELFLLDILLPDQNGLDLIPVINKFSQAPIIVISAKGDLIEKIIGLNSGADDYIVKPFEFQELLARIKSHIRRYLHTGHGISAPKVIKFGECYIDTQKYQLFTAKGKEIRLTPNEMKILLTLVSNPGQIISRDKLLRDTGKRNLDIQDRAIDTYIARIRKKLSDNECSSGNYIRSCRSQGYLYSGKLSGIEE